MMKVPTLSKSTRQIEPELTGTPPHLQQELKQTKPFASLHSEAFLNLLRTADQLQRRLHITLKPHGLTVTQYNALRILRGAGDHPLSCSEIGERLISQEPDITRLLDRMERNGWIQRERDHRDRRLVLSRITAEGREQLKKLDGIVDHCVEQMLQHMKTADLQQMIARLEQARHPEKTPRV
jgi:DNA-binding MarR family transcriptional regulator